MFFQERIEETVAPFTSHGPLLSSNASLWSHYCVLNVLGAVI